jgi:hypothetical protein
MNTANDTTNTISDPQIYWPLPGTLLSNAHLSWNEWSIRLSKEPAADSFAAIRTASSEPDSIRYLEHHGTTTLPAWPLPATGLPNFRISWAEWVGVLTGASSSRPSQTPENPTRAA